MNLFDVKEYELEEIVCKDEKDLIKILTELKYGWGILKAEYVYLPATNDQQSESLRTFKVTMVRLKTTDTRGS